MAKSTALPVLIRVHPKNLKPADVQLSNIEAFFPTEPGTNDPATMTMYCAMGEHSTAVAGYINEKTRPAKPDEVKKMLAHLKRIGYDMPLKVISRMSYNYYLARKAALKM